MASLLTAVTRWEMYLYLYYMFSAFLFIFNAFLFICVILGSCLVNEFWEIVVESYFEFVFYLFVSKMNRAR